MSRIAALVLSAILPAFATAAEAAAPTFDLPNCASARADGVRDTGTGFEARRVSAMVGAAPGASFRAATLKAGGRGVDAAGLRQAATAAEAAMLLAAAHVRDACPGGGAQALAKALGADGRADLAWTSVSVAARGQRFGARSATLHAEGVGPNTVLTLRLDGVVSNAKDAALLPEQFDVTFSLPSDRVPSLLAGGTPERPVPVDVARAEMRRGEVAISGSGHSEIAGTPQQSEADGHLVVRGYDQLMDAAGNSGLGKVRAGLFLGKLVAKHEGDGLAWDLRWEEGNFSVNNVPVPLH